MQETAVRFAICDDDKVYAEKMKALILQTFHLPQPVECIIYLNQEQILKCYREDKIDIVFMDICMPEMNGLQMIAALNSQFPDLEVSVLTGYRDFEYAKEAVHLEIEEYILKPLNAAEITKVFEDLKNEDKKIKSKKKVEDKKMEKTLTIEGMMCGHCEARVKKALEALPEVKEAVVSHEAGTAVVTLESAVSDEALKEAVEAQDYKVISVQ